MTVCQKFQSSVKAFGNNNSLPLTNSFFEFVVFSGYVLQNAYH
jgi:hypothetical protein